MPPKKKKKKTKCQEYNIRNPSKAMHRRLMKDILIDCDVHANTRSHYYYYYRYYYYQFLFFFKLMQGPSFFFSFLFFFFFGKEVTAPMWAVLCLSVIKKSLFVFFFFPLCNLCVGVYSYIYSTSRILYAYTYTTVVFKIFVGGCCGCGCVGFVWVCGCVGYNNVNTHFRICVGGVCVCCCCVVGFVVAAVFSREKKHTNTSSTSIVYTSSIVSLYYEYSTIH